MVRLIEERASSKLFTTALKSPSAPYNIKPVEYDCGHQPAKKKAETRVISLVKQEKAKQQKSAAIAAESTAERERQRKLLEQRKQKALAEKRKQEEKLQLEAAAIAASEVKQAQLNDEITQKMLKLCDKSWRKGEQAPLLLPEIYRTCPGQHSGKR